MEFRRLFDILHFQENRYPQKSALVCRNGKSWKSYSTQDSISIIQALSAGLLKLGLKKGDKLGIITHIGSPHWLFFDLAAQQIGLIVVPVHASITEEDLIYIFNDAEIKIVILQDKILVQRIQSLKEQLTSLKYLYSLEEVSSIDHWTKLKLAPNNKHLSTFESIRAAIHEDDLVTIIYTSGTTGQPKGVMLSHKNIVSNIKSVMALVPINCDKRVLSFLPMSHIFERMVVYLYMAVGASVHFAQKLETVMEDIKSTRPHFFTCVPHFLERYYEGILSNINQRSLLSKRIGEWSIRLGNQFEYSRRLSLWFWVKLKIADLLVYRKWRSVLGNRVEGVVVGAAALSPNLARLFSAAGIEIREGYGLTETSPVLSFNRFEPGGVRLGTVGIPIPGVEVKISSPDENGSGEIFVKGPNVMLGYFNQPDKTKNIFDDDGWLKTGDVGRIVHKRFLEITDRKKDIFKTTSGKYVSPNHIETQLKKSPFVDQCLIIGFNRPSVAALIVPDYNRLEKWAAENKVHWTAPQFMAINPKVIQHMEAIVEKVNEGLTKAERVRKVHLLHENWTVENGGLTTTLKTRRTFIVQKYLKDIEKLYESST